MSDHEGGEATYRAIHDGVAWRVVARDGVVVAGVDAATWLQGQVSQDLDLLRHVGANADTLVLSPQGRIDSYCRVTKVADDPEGYLLDVKAGAGTILYERLRRFKLRVKASVEPLERLHVLEQRGPGSRGIGDRTATSPPHVIEMCTELGGLADVRVCWPGLEGTDWLFTGDQSKVEAFAASIGLGGNGGSAELDEAFEAARIEAGAPELGRELTERTIPQEAGELVSRTVSFTKGCYTGQELVARIDARGSNTPRRLRGLVVAGRPAGGGPGLGGSRIMQGEQTVGEVTSSAWSPGLGAHVALGYVKRGVDVPAQVTVDVAPQNDGRRQLAHGEVRELPISSPKGSGELR